ncbi:hypothetical protein ACH5RR_015160 [Cinchona calisaya]|uniref:Uncharacterized protein n=1 Tax=Cinchona calisaya TaxID=153742 RepID=A0ABD2ZU36_9GENT
MNTFFQVIERPNGWPLGLGNINMRFRVTQNPQAAAAAVAAHTAAADQSSSEMPSPSFSSFSSSNLDTESTASFFQDQSVSLGRLIGIRPGNRGSLQFPNTMQFRQHRSFSSPRSNAEVSRAHGVETSQGLCVPLLQNVIEKMSRSKSTSRH